MKQLSLLMFALLILGCSTEKPAVNELEPVVEELAPGAMEDRPLRQPAMIAEGTVKHGEVNVDPQPLNLNGFRFVFKEPVYDHWVSVYDKNRGKHLTWNSPHAYWCTGNKSCVYRAHGVPQSVEIQHGLRDYDIRSKFRLRYRRDSDTVSDRAAAAHG